MALNAKTYRRKASGTVQAVILDGSNINDVATFARGRVVGDVMEPQAVRVEVPTLDGVITAEMNDVVFLNPEGHIKVMVLAEFNKLYELSS